MKKNKNFIVVIFIYYRYLNNIINTTDKNINNHNFIIKLN